MSSVTGPTPPNLILGCGYLGRRIAARWLAAGRRVAALTRSQASSLVSDGIEPIVGDVLNPASLQVLPVAETVLYSVGWDRTTGTSMREVLVGGLGHVLDTLPPCSRFVYVSSTGVYGQTGGELVDETDATEPAELSGTFVLEAEHLLRARRPDAIILRFAGMYGPNRLLRKQQILAGTPLAGRAEQWLNLIHIDDGTDAVLAAASRGQPGETYNIVDDEPVTRTEFFTLLAELLGAPPARFEDQPEPGQANRRVSNAKAKLAMGWQPRHPSFREGLPAAVMQTTDGVKV